jgi:pyruvate dehydrogenase E2 component (dihydrolipoamide acetyltransferase)
MPHEIRIPRLGWSMEEGVFVRWLKSAGERVAPGDALFELESDKATQEVEAVDEGVLHISSEAPQPGEAVAVGALLGYLLGENETPPELREGKRVEEETERGESRGVGHAVGHDDSSSKVPLRRESPTAVASPRARRVAKELGVDWSELKGSGRNGRVREVDVRAAVKIGAERASEESAPRGERRRLSSRRRAIAERMLLGHRDAAPVTLTTRADAMSLVALRRQLQSSESGAAPAYTDIIVSLTAHVLRRHPWLAARWEEGAIALPEGDDFDIAIAVDCEEGLLAPVLRNVCGMTISELAVQARDLADRARIGKLAPHELQGAAFTVTNLGAYGIDAFTPIINTPQTAILGIGAIRREAVVTGEGTIAARDQITLSLTFDHRVIDGAPAARFLQDLVQALECVK